MQRSTCISVRVIAVAGVCLAGSLVAPRPMNAQDTTAVAKPKKVQKGNSSLITEAEVASTIGVANTAYDVIEKVRPSMLQKRGTAVAGIMVYHDDVRTGGLEKSLRSISADQIKEIRFLSARDATTRWGTGVDDGVIQVISKR